MFLLKYSHIILACFYIFIIIAALELHDISKYLISLDNEIVSLMESMTTDKLGRLLTLLESFDNKLEELVNIIDEDNKPSKAKAIVLEYIGYLENGWSRRVPRCIGLEWNGEDLKRNFNWTDENMDDLMTQVGGFQYDWECLEELLGMTTTVGTTKRTRPTRSVYKHKSL